MEDLENLRKGLVDPRTLDLELSWLGDAMDRSRWVLVLEQLVGWYEMGVNRDRF